MGKQRPIRVLVMGYPYFINRLRELGANSQFQFGVLPRSRFGRWLALFRTDLIYLIGGELRPNRFYSWAFLLGKKVIVHWVGSDILEMRAWHSQGRRFSILMQKKAEHWAEVEWTAAELAELGVRTRIVPLTPAVFPEKYPDLPKKFVALTYLPPDKADFYGEPDLVRLAKRFPEITFLAAAASPTDRKPEWPPNLIPIGWVDRMSELYREVIVLIRLTQHDGLSFMVLEALAQARHVIWSYSLPGVIQARNYEEAAPVMGDLYQAFLSERLLPNTNGRTQVERSYRPSVVWDRIQNAMVDLLAR